MSRRYKGAVLSATPPTTSTSSASGVWTEQQFMQGVASGSWPALAGAPTIGTATAGALSASVAFTAPTYTGSGITGYTATSSPGGITGTGASSPVTVSGLTAGTAYTFTVTATTAAGQGPASAASNSVTPTAPLYIEDVYSTYLYTGNGSTQTITNGIDLSTNGGMVWTKSRSNAQNNWVFDTVRGGNSPLLTNTNGNVADNYSTYFSPATNIVLGTTTGYSLAQTTGGTNTNNFTYVGWTFRKQPKFFDIVTYTGNGSARTIAHNLGSVPACMIIKCTSLGYNWMVYHSSLGNTQYLNLNNPNPVDTDANLWNSTTPTSTVFSVGASLPTNGSGETYIAYLFAHNAGGFGATGTDNVISCGSFTTPSSGDATITLGYEPQWLMVKSSSNTSDWSMVDTMRGLSQTSQARLDANLSSAEEVSTPGWFIPTATGFTAASGSIGPSRTFIYIAIRRGPMKVPTDATTVFKPIAATTGTQTTNFPIDLQISNGYSTTDNKAFSDRLRGFNSPNGVANQPWLRSNSTAAEATNASLSRAWNNTGFLVPPYYDGGNGIYWCFRRAPSFFDEVCYTGTGAGSGNAKPHNLGVVPELMIVKRRSAADYWMVYSATTGKDASLYLNVDDASFGTGGGFWGNGSTTISPTASNFYVGDRTELNSSGSTYVAYLFATCAGVSKVGSYTGNGTTQTINCGFTSGARFVLIKRTNAVGDWYVYDTARGMTTLTDPYLLLNSTAAETATLGSVTTVSTGFALNSTILAAINVSGGTYIFLAIA